MQGEVGKSEGSQKGRNGMRALGIMDAIRKRCVRECVRQCGGVRNPCDRLIRACPWRSHHAEVAGPSPGGPSIYGTKLC